MIHHIRRVSKVSFLLIVLLACSVGIAKAGVFFSADFETPGLVGWSPNLCCEYSLRIIDSLSRAGSYAAKFTVNSDNHPTVRALLRKFNTAHVGDTRWYGFSVMVDPSWQDNSGDSNGTIVTEWHAVPEPGETKSSHLALRIKGDRWVISNLSDMNLITTTSSIKKITWDAGQITKGNWVDWVVYAKWSYQSDGALKIWKDGVLIVDKNGPNTFNDLKPEFMSIGIYKSWWNNHVPSPGIIFTISFDEIRIGDQNSTYQEVAPRGSRTSQTVPPPSNLKVISE